MAKAWEKFSSFVPKGNSFFLGQGLAFIFIIGRRLNLKDGKVQFFKKAHYCSTE